MAALKPVPLERADVADTFWAPRMETNRAVTLPIEYEQCRKTGRLDAFKMQWKPGEPNPPHHFWDSDVYKWLEAAAYALGRQPDKALQRRVDAAAAGIVAAQQPDGYLNVHFTVVEPQQRWANLRDNHELYTAGHFMEAAVAHYEATGSRALIDAACRLADLIGSVFGTKEGRKRGYPGHEEIELALVRLYRATGCERYLRLARYFVDERGRQPHYFDVEAAGRGETQPPWHYTGHEYSQAHLPVREQTTAEGHAVRAMYLYSGMADLAAETGDRALRAACRRLFRNVTERRMYITGGVGSSAGGERFTRDYDLPNETAYAETCAAIGLVFFAHRMVQLERDGRYADVMERALYNGVLSGVSLDGRRFFYANPLVVFPRTFRGGGPVTAERQEWFGCACCPPNIARLLASLPRYAYSEEPRGAWVHLYMAGRATLGVAGQAVELTVRTDYPWKEEVSIDVAPERPAAFTLALRVPGWCRAASLKVNGSPVALDGVLKKGYAHLKRTWPAGDRVELTLPMPVERVRAHPKVRADLGRVALQRGPVVYCLEEVDNGAELDTVCLPRKAALRAQFRPGLLGGVVAITAAGRRCAAGRSDALYSSADVKAVAARLTAVPYYAWCNRSPGEMLVWVREC
jgi:DUF1680 family protein